MSAFWGHGAKALECPLRLNAHLFRFDVGFPDYLSPLLSFIQFIGRHRLRFDAKCEKASLERRIGKTGIDLLVESADNLSGCIFRRANSEPCRRLIAGHKLTYGRDVWKQFRSHQKFEGLRRHPLQLERLLGYYGVEKRHE